MKRSLLFICLSLFITALFAQKDTLVIRKEYQISRAEKTPKIDGVLDDAAWENISIINSFTQNYPIEKAAASQKTDVKLVYDNTAVYICAKLYDSSPDSICHQLGNRDDDVRADLFRIVFDTYNSQQDGFDFTVTASGVQQDSRFSDYLYNAVWESAVKINPDGWSAEIKIPYSALRFPNKEKQIWGMQITRTIARNNEFVQWCLTPRGAANGAKYWGILTGLDNIKEPIRLSLTPYITAYTSHYPTNVAGESNYTSNITGGLDLKYGINESFTLDMTLLPDFTQVQSDNVVKNLSAFEVQYDEQRPFFQESTDLFQKGDLFYSRRIGRRPSGYYDAYYLTAPGEVIIKNPDQAKLLNSTKISGRTSNGLGVGLFNSVLDDTYAVAKDSMGVERKILTEPFSNYNIVVFDQQFKNSSSAYIINTNVNRQGNYNNANVTGAGVYLQNKKASYHFDGSGAVSNVFYKNTGDPNQLTDLVGYQYRVNISKISGKFTYGATREVYSPTFNNNDMGITRETNFINHAVGFGYNQFKSFGKFLNASANVEFFNSSNFTNHRDNGSNMNWGANATFKSFDNIYIGGDVTLTEQIDYYEPRTPGRILIRPKGMTFWTGVNSDSRRRLNVSLNCWGGSTGLISPTIGYNPYFGFDLIPRIRFTDKFSMELSTNYSEDRGDRGFVNRDEWGNIIFGVRYLTNMTNTIGARYLFRNNLSLSLRARHYWARGDYRSFYNLTDEGRLIDNISYDQNHDFNFNAFNVDMVFQWQFAPGSYANLVWKNSIYNEGSEVINSYSTNLNNTFEAKQLNTVSLKILYYFDYLYLRKRKSK